MQIRRSMRPVWHATLQKCLVYQLQMLQQTNTVQEQIPCDENTNQPWVDKFLKKILKL